MESSKTEGMDNTRALLGEIVESRKFMQDSFEFVLLIKHESTEMFADAYNSGMFYDDADK